MKDDRAKNEAQIRAAIAEAEASARLELECSKLCRDPRNIDFRRRAAALWREVAAEYRSELAMHLLLTEEER